MILWIRIENRGPQLSHSLLLSIWMEKSCSRDKKEEKVHQSGFNSSSSMHFLLESRNANEIVFMHLLNRIRSWFIYFYFISMTTEVHGESRAQKARKDLNLSWEDSDFFPFFSLLLFRLLILRVYVYHRAKLKYEKNANWKTCIIETKDNKFETFLYYGEWESYEISWAMSSIN